MKADKRLVVSVLVVFSMFAASLASIGDTFADDTPVEATATFTATPTFTPTPTETPTEEIVPDEELPADDDPAPENPPDEPTDPTETPPLLPTETPVGEETPTPEEDGVTAAAEEATATPEFTPIATEEAEEVVPLIMPEDTSHVIPDQYIVIYKNNKVNDKKLKAAGTNLKEKGGEVKQRLSGRINGYSAKLTKNALKSLRQDPDIAYIEPDQYVTVFDEGVTAQTIAQPDAPWGLDRIDQASLPLDGFYHYPTTAGAGVHVYVLDSGIYTAHTDFGGRVLDAISFIDGDSDPSDCFGHGTKVAGVIAGETYGVAKAAYLHSVRVLDCDGYGEYSWVIAGLNWVIANHSSPAVVNMSLGGGKSTAMNQAVEDTVAAGITVVVASGNIDAEHPEENACEWSPASAASALTIGASTITDAKAYFSTYGGCLDMFAPGTNIPTTNMSGGVENVSGTSIASPHVAGAAALYLADNPGAGPSAVTSALIAQSTKDVISDPGGGSPNRLLSVTSTDMSQVVLISPENASYTNQTTLTLAWNTTYIGDTYDVQVDDNSDFSSPAYDQNIETTSVDIANFTDAVWYWRVRSVNIYAEAGDWSETWSFTVDTIAPDVPALLSPQNGVDVYVTPAFEWDTAAGAAVYQFEYNNINDPETFIYRSEDLALLTHTPPAMATGNTYYWFARAGDEAGNWSAWSDAYTVTVYEIPPTPSKPALRNPLHNAVINDDTPEAAWWAADFGTSYHVQIAADSGFTAVNQEQEDIVGLSYTASELVDGKYYWRVRARNAVGVYGSWSTVWSFTADTVAPDAPVLLSPENGFDAIGMPTFKWRSSATAAYYQFEFGLDNDPETYEFRSDEVTAAFYRPVTKTLGVEYYWFVRARDTAGNWSAWSDPFTITIEQPVPARVSLDAPSGGYLSNVNTPELSWDIVEYSAYYHIQIASDSRFTTIFEEQEDIIGLTHTPAELADGRYYWRVRARNEVGEYGSWSGARYFTIDTIPPDAPVLRSPIDVTTYTGTPTFKWYKSATASYYQFEYSAVDNDPENSYIYRADESKKYYIKPPAMEDMATYYWFARARDKAGNWSAWSESFAITIVPPTPPRPAAVSPANGSLTTNKTPDLTWTAVEHAISYHIQLSSSSRFTAIVQELEGIPGLAYTAAELSDGRYYWRVRAVNAIDDYGSWSKTRYFTVDTTSPDAPVLRSPVDVSTYAGTPTFKWYKPASASYYQFEYSAVDNDPENSYIYRSEESRRYYYKPPTMEDMATYYWFARARDKAGNWSDWSEPFAITIVPPTPSRPVTVSPNNGSLTTDTTPDLTWAAVEHAVSYHIQLSTSSRFSPVVQESEGIPGLAYTAAELADGRYYWRVRAVNAIDGYGSWSKARYFTVDTTPPDAPLLLRPYDASEVIGTPTFVWSRPSTAKYYQYEYSTVDNDPENTYDYRSEETTKYKFKPPAMDTMTTYYWFVRARDKAGNWSDWSAASTFMVVPPTPARPSQGEPVNKYLTNVSTPEFSWAAVDYADAYHIQISSSSRFTTMVQESESAELTYTASVLADGRYYWRVQARNENNVYGSWSRTRYFTVDTVPPSVPVLRSPVNDGAVAGTPTFKWYKVSGARYYQFEYSAIDTDPENTYIYRSDEITRYYHKPPTMEAMTTNYWFARVRDKAGNWSDWSTAFAITVEPTTPARVVLDEPANGINTDEDTFDLSWDAVDYGNVYQIQIDNSSRFRNPEYTYDSDVEALSKTVGPLEPGKWYWRVRAVNEVGVYGSWSKAYYFRVYPKIDSRFDVDGDLGDWMARSGADWGVSGGGLYTAGLSADKTTSISYSDTVFSDFTYEADIKMDAPASGEYNVYGLVLRGSPVINDWNDWRSGIYFTIKQVNDANYDVQYTCALIYSISNSKWTFLGGSCGQAAYSDFNNLKVYAKGRTMKFYVNDYLVLNKSIRGFSSGNVGIVSWGRSAKMTTVDYALAGLPVEPVAAGTMLGAQTVLPFAVDPQEQFNEIVK